MGDTRHSNSSSNNKFNSNNNKICIIQEVNNHSHNSSSKWEAGTSILDQQRNNTGLIIGPVEGIRINRAANILHNNNNKI